MSSLLLQTLHHDRVVQPFIAACSWVFEHHIVVVVAIVVVAIVAVLIMADCMKLLFVDNNWIR